MIAIATEGDTMIDESARAAAPPWGRVGSGASLSQSIPIPAQSEIITPRPRTTAPTSSTSTSAVPSRRPYGAVSARRLPRYYQNCRSFVFPGVEDFGITPLEATACGRPVVMLVVTGTTSGISP